MTQTVDQSRRALLFGRPGRAHIPLRPPWAEREALFTQRCTQCADCVNACETGIIVHGGGGYPEVDFSVDECTFCGACAQACGEAAFLDTALPPWDYVATISQGCLGVTGVYCRSCGESCEAGAIRFSFNEHRVPEPDIDTEACTGCGACVAICPTRAIQVGPPGKASTRVTHG